MQSLLSASLWKKQYHSWGTVLVLLAVATAICGGLDDQISQTSQAMVYLLAVVVAAYHLPLMESLACTLGSVIAFNFFFVPPRWTFEVDSRENLLAVLTLLVVSLVISHLTARLRRNTDLARLNAMRAQQLQVLAVHLFDLDSEDALLAQAQHAFDSAYAGRNTLVMVQDDGSLRCAKDSAQKPAATVVQGLQCCVAEAAALGPGTGRWPGLDAWFLPIGHSHHILGAVCIAQGDAANVSGREHAEALCMLVAQALQRLRLTRAMQASHAQAQRQQIQSTFLAAISHDLRTPLAAVVGAASALQSQGDKLGMAEQQRLLASIVSEATHLATLTDNTLQLVQLTNTAQPLLVGWESIEEIVGAVLGRMRLRDAARRIACHVPPGLPLIEADPVLLAQLIDNLLDNALKYSQGPIFLAVQCVPAAVQISVKDRGDAISPDRYEAIFMPYARNDHSGQRGAGLGLALCRAITHIHGGSLTLRRRRGGGNAFVLMLPVNPDQPRLEAL